MIRSGEDCVIGASAPLRELPAPPGGALECSCAPQVLGQLGLHTALELGGA